MATQQPSAQCLRMAVFSLLLSAPAAPAWACRVCRPRVQAIIHAPDYTQNLLLILLPVGLLLLLGIGLFFAGAPKQRFISSSSVPHG